jgi:hypothetical protein
MTWSFDLPGRLKMAIKDAITIFSRIGHAVVGMHLGTGGSRFEAEKAAQRKQNFKTGLRSGNGTDGVNKMLLSVSRSSCL